MFDSENILCKFGTQLEVIEEDEIPTKKPVSVEDQIVTDSNGKRRFHGAFTGGFSAGFWNTVGSLEGWKPQQYKSSRSEKAETKAQKPVDFMDEEDLGEFGIAPQRIQTTEDFSAQESSSTGNIRKRKYIQSLGPIPGIPVLQQLLQPAKESVAIRLLKKMGWKVGQGIGARQTRKEKKAASRKITSEHYGLKKYGCEVGPLEHKRISVPQDASESDDTDEEITYAPDDYEQLFVGVKDNVFGLGYIGLKRSPLPKNAQHIDLFGPFEMMSKNNKKLSIRGQAFGVGALEEEDEDIYAKEDMSKYDFSLEDRKSLPKKRNNVSDVGVIDGFHVRENENAQTRVFQVDIPEQFKPRNWAVRRSRFEPLDEEKAVALKLKNEHKRMGLGRHDLGVHERRNILENMDKKSCGTDANQSQECVKSNYWKKINQKYKDREAKTAQVINLLEKNKSNFTTGGLLTIDGKEINLGDEVVEKRKEKPTEVSNITDPGKSNTVFKPFVFNERKQNRYDKYLEANLKTDQEITTFLETIQPVEMSDWDKEMEKKEFIQASKIYKPLKGLMSDRFISEGSVKTNKTNQETYVDPKKTEVKRTKIIWHPCALLCKRFNVAQPYAETKVEDNSKKKSRFSVFDYIEAPINTKKDFVTPVIIPSKIEKSREIISQNECVSFENQRLTTKELFVKERQSSDQCNTDNIICDKNKKPILSPALSSGEMNASKKVTVERNSKMELEKQIKAMKNEHASEKKDLFKAIFESSSDEEDENSNERNEDRSSNTENNIQKPVNLKTPATAAELNILRNTSPPRGIFAYLFSEQNEQKPLKHNSIKKSENCIEKDFKDRDKKGDKFRSDPIVEKSSSEYYGPAIPTVRTIIECSTSSPKIEDLDEKLTKLVKSKKRVKLVEEWIEKAERKKEKKRKKNKKKKSKKTKKEKHTKSSSE